MTKSTFEEQLEKNGRLIYTNVGDSMWPLIRQGKDLLVIEPVHGRLRKYDVPLYVLHRILEVRRDDYVICGDNRSRKEYGITDRHIIGVLTGIVRSGKTVSVKNKWYRLYVHIWCDFFPLRSLIIRVYGKLKRILRKKKR